MSSVFYFVRFGVNKINAMAKIKQISFQVPWLHGQKNANRFLKRSKITGIAVRYYIETYDT